MQAFEDLKQDIQSLIDTAGETIKTIVDEAARRVQEAQRSQQGQMAPGAAAGQPGMATQDGSEFTSEIEELRTRVRAAVDHLKQQAKAAFDNPSFQNTSGSGSSGSGSTSGGAAGSDAAMSGSVTGNQPGTDASATDGTPSANPDGSPKSPEQLTQDALNRQENVQGDVGSLPAASTGLPPAPDFGAGGNQGSTIGPDSFKSGA